MYYIALLSEARYNELFQWFPPFVFGQTCVPIMLLRTHSLVCSCILYAHTVHTSAVYPLYTPIHTHVHSNSHTSHVCNVSLQSDMADRREVSTIEGEQLAAQLQCPFFETSAKMRINIDECFHDLVREIKKIQLEQSKQAQETPSSGGCCVLL